MMEGERRSYGMVCLPGENGWSAPLEGAWVAGLSQEHGIVHLPETTLARLCPGDLLCIIPAHSCLTVTLMKRYLTLDGRSIETMNV
jgi:D-serine deaminase-like pyridoxal phosphate-dependent protein